MTHKYNASSNMCYKVQCSLDKYLADYIESCKNKMPLWHKKDSETIRQIIYEHMILSRITSLNDLDDYTLLKLKTLKE